MNFARSMDALTEQDLQRIRKNLFFVVGTSRSGTTLLQAMLSSHSEITLPPETHFFHEAANLKKHFPPPLDDDDRKKLVGYWQGNRTRMRDLSLSTIHIQDAAEKFKPNSIADFFLLNLALYANIRGKTKIGEKTPRHIRHVEEMLEFFPDAKIIALFRDPRAAALSEINASFGSPSVAVTARRWKEYVNLHLEYEAHLPANQYMMIRYEDLIEEPEAYLQQLCDFLEVPFEVEMLRYYQRGKDEKGFPEHEKWKTGTMQPVQKDRNERWERELSENQVQLVEYLAGGLMDKLGYERLYSANDIASSRLQVYRLWDFSKSIVATITGSRKQGYREAGRFSL